MTTTTISRQERVMSAWADAFRRVSERVDWFCAKHGPPPNCIDMVRDYAPGLADGIQRAEEAAEAASVEWAKGGPGGVQAKIDVWVALWVDALDTVALAR